MRVAAVVPVALALVACGVFPSLDHLGECAEGCPTASGAGASGTAAGGASSAAGASTGGGAGGADACAAPREVGQRGVLVTPLGNKAPFCIDAHEVSFGELSAGIAAYHTDKNALYPLVEPECDWAWATLEPFSSRITQEGLNFANGWRDYPAVGLDWCEARAFCALLGKDLCGDLEGGANEADNSRSRWYMACSKNTAFIHSFQESPGPIACHAEDASTCPSIDAMLPVTATSCPGGFDGLFNMSGNAWEWTRHCYRGRGTAESDDCQVRGGNCASADISCGASATFSRSNLSEDITFRCCWSPAP